MVPQPLLANVLCSCLPPPLPLLSTTTSALAHARTIARLQRYGTFTRLKQVALRRIVAAMTPAMRPPCVAVYVEAFNRCGCGGMCLEGPRTWSP
jgi:hypothetical protein